MCVAILYIKSIKYIYEQLVDFYDQSGVLSTGVQEGYWASKLDLARNNYDMQNKIYIETKNKSNVGLAGCQ